MLDVKETSVGKGLFSNRNVVKGECVSEITGDYVSDFDPSYRYYIDISDDLVMDPHSPFRFINHSRNPNCQFVVEFWDDNYSDLNRVYLEALKDIKAGDEFNTDYAWKKENTIKCQCGSEKCRGWIVAESEMSAV